MPKKRSGQGNCARTVCIDSFEQSRFIGRSDNPSLQDGRRFDSLMECLLQMEALPAGGGGEGRFRSALELLFLKKAPAAAAPQFHEKIEGE